MSSYIVIKNWDRFQHYKDRDPPWIKLYRDMLTSESWLMGTDSSRLVQVASVLIAARYSNKIPLLYPLIQKVSNLDMDEATFRSALTHLEATDFLEIQRDTRGARIQNQHASNTIAKCSSEQSKEEDRVKKKTEQSREDSDARAREGEQDASDSLAAVDDGRRSEQDASEPVSRLEPKDDHEAMDRIQASYPRGSNPPNWMMALHNARGLVDDGLATWDELVAATDRYARFVSSSGTLANVAAHNFFDRRKGNHWQQPWDPPPTKADQRLESNINAAAEAKRQLFGSGS